MKGKGSYLLLSFVILVLDQVTKAWATASLQPVGSVEVVAGFFRLSYARNRGVAFSLFADSEFDMQWVLAGVSALAAVAVAGYLSRTAASHARLNAALALLLAGIMGNLIDRVRLGEVVDFLDFHWGSLFTWPTFNVADAAICIGAGLLALELLREEKAAARGAAAAEEGGMGSPE
jgi:signal peptidase II